MVSTADTPAPDSAAAVELLRKRIDDAIAYTRSRRKSQRFWASAIRIASVFLSGSATIILGLQSLTGWAAIAFSFTALVTLLGALEPFFNFRAIWVLLEEAQEKHHRLKDDLEFYLAELGSSNPSPEKLQEFHDRSQQIWSIMAEGWLAQRRMGSRFLGDPG